MIEFRGHHVPRGTDWVRICSPTEYLRPRYSIDEPQPAYRGLEDFVEARLGRDLHISQSD